MTEREFIKNIINRLQRQIYYEDSNTIEFDGDSYESIVIKFDENGLVTAIY